MAETARTPRLLRPPLCEARSRVFDSRRWDGYRPRPDDVVIATYSKCGTTWTQRIVSMLVFADDVPRPLWELSPWPDARFGPPIEQVLALAEAQEHRRFFKSHLALSALPLYDEVRYVHVARDGRDACLSLHNHLRGFTPEALAMLDAISVADPKYGDPFPRVPEDPAAFFRDWVANDRMDGAPELHYFALERSFWSERRRDNVLLVHYADLKADLDGEMRRIARFLGADVPAATWPRLVDAARFESMQRDGDALLSLAHQLWDHGPKRFLHQGAVGRWRELFAPEDVARYEERAKSELAPGLARWLEHGRLGAGDPRDAED